MAITTEDMGLSATKFGLASEDANLPTLLQNKSSFNQGKVAAVVAKEGEECRSDVPQGRSEEHTEEHTEEKDDDEDDEGPEKEAKNTLEEAARKRAADDELFWTAAQAALRDRERLEKVRAFLKAHNFTDVNARRGWMFSYDYPLHCAAKHGDVEIVRLLLASKAVRRQRDSEGRTARHVAKNQNYDGSHDAVIKALTGKKRVKKTGAAEAKASPATAAGTEATSASQLATGEPAEEAEASTSTGATAVSLPITARQLEGEGRNGEVRVRAPAAGTGESMQSPDGI